MQAVAHNPKFAKKAGVPQSVGREFTKSEGGQMKNDYMKKEKTHVAAMKKAGVPKKIVKEEMAEAGMKKGGKVKCMAKGGGIESKGKTKGKMIRMSGCN